jgi:hypothetical protein
MSRNDTPRPRFGPLGFWIGLPFVALLSAVSWLGFLHAANDIRTERRVYGSGVLAAGEVVKKTVYHPPGTSQTVYYVTYAFRTPGGLTFRREVRVEPDLWYRVAQNGPIAVRYVPEEADLNLPDGRHLSSFFYLVGGIALAGALLFSVVAIGMLGKKLAGGYRGEPVGPGA